MTSSIDMAGRYKANRALMFKSRQRREELRKLHNPLNDLSSDTDVSAEDIDKIIVHIKERKRDENRYFNRMILTFFFISLIIFILLYFTKLLFFS